VLRVVHDDCRLDSNDLVADESVVAMGRSFTWVQKDSFASEPLPMLVIDGSKSSVCIWYIIATSVSWSLQPS